MARVPYLEKAQTAPEVREVFEKMEARGARILNLYKAVAHSSAAFGAFNRLGSALLQKAKLDPKLRELAILRIAKLCGSEYEWAQHVPFARDVGISQAQIDSIGNWQKGTVYSEREKSVLQYVDEVTQNVKVNDATFNALKKHLDNTSIVELTLSIGFWGMVARVLVPLQVEVEKELPTSSRDLLGRSR